MTKEEFEKIWKLQLDLFNAQRDIIVWLSQFAPVDKQQEYNLKILRINSILEQIKMTESRHD